jgi:hypothetical protein
VIDEDSCVPRSALEGPACRGAASVEIIEKENRMRTWVRRATVAGIVAMSMLGVGATAANAADAPRHGTATSTVVHPDAYIYGVYADLLDCEAAGAYGEMNGWWHNYGCDNRYYPGYIALVIYS